MSSARRSVTSHAANGDSGSAPGPPSSITFRRSGGRASQRVRTAGRTLPPRRAASTVGPRWSWASKPHASAAPRGRVEATTIPGTKVLLDLPPKAVVVCTPSRQHRKRQTPSCRSVLVRDGSVGVACCGAYRLPTHQHDAGWSHDWQVCGPIHLAGSHSAVAAPGATEIGGASCRRFTSDRRCRPGRC
jgi:hypothetical protein